MAKKPLPRFAESKYSVFVSYSGGDTDTYGNWPVDFAQQLRSQITAALSSHRSKLAKAQLPGPHAFELDGIAGGALSDELKKRIAESFAMVVVVGSGYVSSPWCTAEMQYFHDLFGVEGVAKRLFIAVLDPNAMAALRDKPHWQHLVPADQAVVPFYRDAINTPFVPVMRPNGDAAHGDFLPCFTPLRARLVTTIVADIDQPVEVPAVQVLIGVCVEELDAEVKLFADAVRSRGLSVDLLGRRQDMAARIKRAERLVLPFNRAAPLFSTEAGGHLASQVALWTGFRKPIDRIYGLDLSHISGTEPAQATYLDYIDQWDRAKQPEAVLEALFPPTGNSGAPRGRARVLIESNQVEVSQWKYLTRVLRERWDVLLDKQIPALDRKSFPLFTRGFRVDCLGNYALDDADGLILLWGHRTEPTLRSYIDDVDRNLHSPAPVFVAYLFPPNLKSELPMPAVDWEVLRFNKEPDDPDPPNKVTPEAKDEGQLTEFLCDVLERARGRLPPAVPSQQRQAA